VHRRQRSDQEFDQTDGTRIAPKQIPVPIDRDGGKRLLLRQHVIERFADFAQLGSGQVGLPPDRREACGHQQGIVLT
jgi:hypothetical protein